MTFDEAFHRLLGHEGGYSNHPDDPGKETMWGVTAAVARQQGYMGPMRELPVEIAKDIYLRMYWTPVKADALPDALRFDVFDAAVNSGTRAAGKWLQAAIGMPASQIDGIVGPATIAAAQAAEPLRVFAHMNGERLEAMTEMGNWGTFSRGWARRIASNLKAA